MAAIRIQRAASKTAVRRARTSLAKRAVAISTRETSTGPAITIALGPGRYDTGQGGELGPGVFDTLSKIRVAGIPLRGTSVARTTLFSARPAPPAGATGDAAMLVVEAADVEISDLRFESPHPAVDILAGGAATVRRVVLDGTFGGLAAALGGVGVFEDVLARNWFGYPLVYAVAV